MPISPCCYSDRHTRGVKLSHVMMRSQLLALICLFPYLIAALRPTVVIRQAAAVPSPDPCGPKVQDPNQFGQPANTCNGTAIPALPATEPRMYAAYLDDNAPAAVYPPQHTGSPDYPAPWARACKTSITYLCTGISNANLGQWSTNNFGVSCTASVWLNDPVLGAPFPTPYHCMNDILFPMLKILDVTGATTHTNRVSVNIPTNGFPDGISTGMQINTGYPSWMIQ